MKVSPYRAAKTDKKKREAIELYKQGLSLRAASRVVGMSHQWVANALNDAVGELSVIIDKNK